MDLNKVETIYRLTPVQEVLLRQNLETQKPEDFCWQVAWELNRDLNVSLFERAWRQVIEHHTLLRTGFFWKRLKSPVQVVRNEPDFALVQYDWRELSGAVQEERVRSLMRDERARGFDLSTPPLMRLCLCRTGAASYRIIWSVHPLLLDERSLRLVLREVITRYEGMHAGTDLQRAHQQHYSDYVGWLKQQDLSGAATFWRQMFEGSAALTGQFLERAYCSLPGADEHAQQRISLTPELTRSLETLARQHQLTLSTFIQASWALLLSRYSSRNDVIFGVTISHRPSELAGADSMLGPLTNTLPLRVQLPSDAGVASWLSELHERQAKLSRFGYSTLELVQNWGDIPAGLCAVESNIVLSHDLEGQPWQWSEGSFDIHKAQHRNQTLHPVTLTPFRDDVLVLQLSYHRRRFDDAAAASILRHLQTLLAELAGKFNRRLADLDMISEEEQLELLAAGGSTASGYREETLVHQLFELQAERTPAAVAAVFNGEQLSYRELNTRANQLAHHLQALGAGPGSRVGLCVERSLDLLIAVFAVWKAGGAYVPLDPAYPTARLSYMLEDAGIEVLLTQRPLLARLPAHTARVVCLDTDWPMINAGSGANLAQAVTGEQLAYLIYTSGTTGQPKGVMVEFGNLAHTLVATQGTFNFKADDVMPCLASYSFDIFLFEMLSPLLAGGTSMLLTKEQTSDPEVLAQILEQATVLHTLPALMRQLVNVALRRKPDNDYHHLRAVFVGGDLVSPELLRDMQQAFPRARVHVLYGPTEATIVCTSYQVTTGEKIAKYMIGRPLDNTIVRLYDADHQLTPRGLTGEICIAGGGVTRGYLHCPELTNEKYVSLDHQRFYKTGDVGRYTGEGELEFLGRGDQQVKVRGYRVETGEVEVQLLRHEGVAQAVVMGREQQPGQVGLVGYVVGTGQQRLEAAELRRHLAELLPEYMVPGVLVVLEEMPLTANGKVDREALAGMESVGAESGAEYQGPRTVVEELVAGIWAEVLGVARVGMQENFFALGGHSLLATQVMSRVREALQVEMPLRSLFEAPTVAGLARELELARASGPGAVAPAIVPVRRTQALPLSFAQQRLWFLDQLEPGSAFYNVPAAVRMSGPLNVRALEETLTEIVRRHEALRTVFPIKDGQPVQQILAAGPVRLEVTELSALAAEEREREARRLATAEAQRPFNLATGPLLRASLLRLSAEEHVALFTLHHIISDGWSLGVLVREVATLYAAYSAGEVSPLPELTIQYADYAHWQREWLQGEVLAEQLAYWREQLAGAPAVLELPADRPRPAVQSFRGASMAFTLPAELTAALQELSRREGVTLFMTLLAGFQTLLYRYTGQTDICVGTDIANRNRAETEALIGFFVNQLVLRTSFSNDLSFSELLHRVRAITLGAYAHQDVPFDKLVEELNPARDVSNTPLFQAKFVLQNAPGGLLEMPNLELRPLEGLGSSQTAKFDLMLTLIDGEQLTGSLSYNTDLFDASTIHLLLERLRTLLGSIVAEPEARLASLRWRTEAESRQLVTRKKRRAELNFERLKNVKPKSIHLSREKLVEVGHLRDGQTLPLVVQPNLAGLDLAEWAKSNQSFIETQLRRHGGLLFRGFALESQSDFEKFLSAVTSELMRYMEGATPRKELSDKVYTSTEYPADQHIALHNELTYVTTWPMKIWFFCQEPATKRGETPIADVRRVLQRIDPHIKQRFLEKGWMLVRNFGEGLSLPWQTSFHTTSKAEVEEYGRRMRVEVEWKTGDGLRTRQVRPAIARHPWVDETVWFNHVAFWHVSSLEPQVREAMLTMFGSESELPYNTYYGDGSPIEDSVVAHIREAYGAERVEFAWQQGDVLMLDNMLVAHGRNPFEGPRKIIVAMAEGFDSTRQAD